MRIVYGSPSSQLGAVNSKPIAIALLSKFKIFVHGPVSESFFRPSGPQFCLKVRGGPGLPGPSPGSATGDDGIGMIVVIYIDTWLVRFCRCK